MQISQTTIYEDDKIALKQFGKLVQVEQKCADGFTRKTPMHIDEFTVIAVAFVKSLATPVED